MMHQVMNDDPVIFIRGWFFDHDLDSITRYDVMDFVSWSMFEGRNLEHLTIVNLFWTIFDQHQYSDSIKKAKSILNLI